MKIMNKVKEKMESLARKRERKEIDMSEHEIEVKGIKGKVRVFWTPVSRFVLIDAVVELLDYYNISYSGAFADVPEDILQKLKEKKIVEWDYFFNSWKAGENYGYGNRVRISGNKYVLIFGDGGGYVSFVTVELRDEGEKHILEDIIKVLEAFERALARYFF